MAPPRPPRNRSPGLKRCPNLEVRKRHTFSVQLCRGVPKTGPTFGPQNRDHEGNNLAARNMGTGRGGRQKAKHFKSSAATRHHQLSVSIRSAWISGPDSGPEFEASSPIARLLQKSEKTTCNQKQAARIFAHLRKRKIQTLEMPRRQKRHKRSANE